MDDLDGVVEDFLTQVCTIEAYAEGRVPVPLLRQDAHATLGYLIGQLAETTPTRSLAAAERVGVDRARRQVPLPALMSAIRLDVEVLWTRLRASLGPDDLAVVVDRVDLLWRVVEDYSRDVQRSYLQEQSIMARERDFERTAVVTRLLDGPVTERAVQRVAAALGVPVDGPLLVLAAPAERRESLWRSFRGMLADRRAVHWHPVGDDVLLVLAATPAEVAAVESGLRPGRLRSVHAVIAPTAHGVAALRDAATLALRCSSLLAEQVDQPQDVRDLWLPLTADGLGLTLGPALAAQVLRRIDEVPEPERERLLETGVIFLECGSVAQTAERCFCHRNTVLNRLGRLRELTDCDLTVPRQAALLQVALAAREAAS